jgi:hypothetical protein
MENTVILFIVAGIAVASFAYYVYTEFGKMRSVINKQQKQLNGFGGLFGALAQKMKQEHEQKLAAEGKEGKEGIVDGKKVTSADHASEHSAPAGVGVMSKATAVGSIRQPSDPAPETVYVTSSIQLPSNRSVLHSRGGSVKMEPPVLEEIDDDDSDDDETSLIDEDEDEANGLTTGISGVMARTMDKYPTETKLGTRREDNGGQVEPQDGRPEIIKDPRDLTITKQQHCPYILTRGRRAGHPCGKTARANGYCGSHQSVVPRPSSHVVDQDLEDELGDI